MADYEYRPAGTAHDTVQPWGEHKVRQYTLAQEYAWIKAHNPDYLEEFISKTVERGMIALENLVSKPIEVENGE